MTQALVPALAQKANIKYEAARYERAPLERSSLLGQLKIRIVLQGNYESVRRFIYAMETAPEFVIIDDVSLAQNDLSKPLLLTLGLSTYHRLDVNGR
jgi:Tfp pilus assembly protein PilO